MEKSSLSSVLVNSSQTMLVEEQLWQKIFASRAKSIKRKYAAYSSPTAFFHIRRDLRRSSILESVIRSSDTKTFARETQGLDRHRTVHARSPPQNTPIRASEPHPRPLVPPVGTSTSHMHSHRYNHALQTCSAENSGSASGCYSITPPLQDQQRSNHEGPRILWRKLC